MMDRTARLVMVLPFVALLAGAGGGCGAPAPAGAPADQAAATDEIQAAVAAPTTLTVSLPESASLKNAALAASGTLLVDSRSTVGTGSPALTVASFGNQTTQIAAGARVNGDVFSVPSVSLGSSARVTGQVKSGGAITAQAGAVVSGKSTANAAISRTPVSWTVTLPATNAGPITVFAGQAAAPEPGSLGAVTVYSNAKLSLKTGTYFFTSFDAEPGATIALDETAGPIVVYVTGPSAMVILRGNLAPVGGTGTNLLLVSLGAGIVDVATPLAGTVVAPNGTVNLDQPNNGKPHVGQVFAKKIELFSAATLAFGSFDWDAFLCGRGDTDGDGVNDCQDQCPTDPKKATAGVCGCGALETDTDRDGVPDCVDLCPSDPARSQPGQCGCANAPKPAGTACTDSICGSAAGIQLACDGAGQCGNPGVCSPDPGRCVPMVFRQNSYWVCGRPTGWTQANVACAAVGLSLARVDSRQENALIASLISGPSWLGGNDQGAAGTWRWPAGSSPNGDVFFSGGAAVNASYTNWSTGTPGDNAGKCAAIQAGGAGLWSDQTCTNPLPYVCKRNGLPFAHPNVPTIACTDFSPNLACPGPFTNCVSSDPFLSETAAQFASEIGACQAANCTKDGDPGCAQCAGAASVPPVGSTCTPTDTSCGITNPHGSCQLNADCPAGEICEKATTCPACDQLLKDAAGQTPPPVIDCAEVCPVPPGGSIKRLQCGTPQPGCAGVTTSTERCQEVNICAPPGSAGDPNPFHSPKTDLTLTTFQFSAAPPPAAAYPPDPACANPPCALGPAHPWCKYQVDNPMQPQNPGQIKRGDSGGGAIQFDFNPNLTLAFETSGAKDTGVFAMGETKFNLRAEAGFSADVTFNFSGIGTTFSIIDAEAALDANRCRAWTIDSRLKLFGIDFLPDLLPDLRFDTNADVGKYPKLLDAQACNDAFGPYETLFHRAKKAMKDAQELLTQYKALKASGKAMTSQLCNQIASDPPFGFPPGDCATESPEATINRFITFYESELAAAVNQEAQLGAQQLKMSLPIPVANIDHEEDQTLFTTTFFVGPVPVSLDLESIEHFGIDGSLVFTVNPGTVLLGSTSQEDLAAVTGVVTPYANAAVSLALSVGFDFGFIAAEAGVEGIITLANISVPVSAGAGIKIQPTDDPRPIPADLASVSDAVPLLRPTQYQFALSFNYGAEVDITQILAGQLNLRVKVAFFFFSKTWRVTLVSFPGFSAPPIPLFGGQSGDIAIGAVPWATLQMPNPFPRLTRLAVPAAPPSGTVQQVAADTGKVEKFFYDSQCQCKAADEVCHRNADCCASAPLCFSDPAGPAGARATCLICRNTTESCNRDSDCCAGNKAGCYPIADTAGAPRACAVCLSTDAAGQRRVCDPNHDLCCDGCFADHPGDPTTGFHCGVVPK